MVKKGILWNVSKIMVMYVKLYACMTINIWNPKTNLYQNGLPEKKNKKFFNFVVFEVFGFRIHHGIKKFYFPENTSEKTGLMLKQLTFLFKFIWWMILRIIKHKPSVQYCTEHVVMNCKFGWRYLDVCLKFANDRLRMLQMHLRWYVFA